MKKTVYILSALALIFSCAKTPVDQLEQEEMVLAPVFPSSGVKATAVGFENGDQIGIYITRYNGDTPSPLQIGGNWGSNLTLSLNGSSWTLDPKVYWEEGKFDIFGYYPRMDVSSVDALPFEVADDQTVTGGVEGMSAFEASDFLWASSKGITRSASVPLVFQHKMCKVNISLKKGAEYEGDLPEDAEVYIHSTVTQAQVDLATGDVIKDSYAGANSIRCRKVDSDSFEAIVVPQRLSNRVPLVEVICGKISYLFESSVVFKSGTIHSITITLSDNPEKVAIEIGGQVVNW